ncbi:MAG: C25 family cysteine peptidase, partial [Bacteroidetes bacterium]|nr:C25 family cysteine peptidase [Bacteroidota bacterium]
MKRNIIFLLTVFVSALCLQLHAGEINTGKQQTSLVYTSGGFTKVSFQASVSTVQFREVMTREGAFTEFFIPDHFNSPVIGDPNLPTCSRLLEVPFNQGFKIDITHTEYQDYDLASLGITNRIMPVQPSLSKGVTDLDQVPFVINNEVYLSNRFLGQPLVSITPAGILRSINLAQLMISPVQYNPVTKQLRIYSIIEASVSFINPDTEASNLLKREKSSIYFNNLDRLVDNSLYLPNNPATTSPVTYVIVSPVMFESALQPLVKWKTRKGFKVIEAYTSNPAVGTTTTSIKNYLKGLYTTPPSGYSAPSFVLFVGDVAQIPAWMNNSQATDLRYCEYTGDNLPEVFYGRFSASSITQLQPYIDKTLEYEQYLFPDDSFLNEVVMVAGYDGGGYGLTYGNGQINYGTNYYFNTAHGLTSHTYLQPQPSGVNYSQLLRQNVSTGVSYANYTAHGSEVGWADPSFVISNIAALQNDHKYSLLVGNCCLTSKYNVNCFAEEITRAANKGAIGYIGASNNSLWDEDYWWGCGLKTVTTSPAYDPLHLGAYDVTFHTHGEPVGSWFTTMAQMVVGGNLAVQQSTSGNKLYYWEIYNLMGDPSLEIYYSVPAPVAATLPQILLIGTTTCTVATEPWSYVAMSLNDSTLLDAKTADSTGTVTLQYSALSAPGYAHFVISKQNRKPLIDSVAIIQPSGPYITLGATGVNDSIGGNDNNLAEYDETVSLNLAINNVGVAPASNLMVSIATTDTNVIILSSNHLFGTIPSDTTVDCTGAFSIKIKNNVSDQQQVSFNLSFTDGTTSWTGVYTMTLHAPVLTIGSITVQDPLPGGNNNGIFDPGESVQLGISISNTGHSPVTNVGGTLHVMAGSSGFILLNNSTSFIGAIPVSGNNNAWFAAVSNGITPPGTFVGLNLSVVAGQSNQFNASREQYMEIGQSAQYPISNTTISACDGIFFDSGGPLGNYANNQELTMTVNPG